MRENRLRVLLIDDDPDDRALARLVLEREMPEVAVEEITDALAFAQACGRRGFALVVLERELRWADGLAVLSLLREDWPEVPVILFTAHGNEEVTLQAIRLGASDYLVKKPANFLRLPLAVRAALDQRHPQPMPPRAAGLAKDVTARGPADRSNEELAQFASMASHELQAPVRMMERYTRLLQEEHGGQLGTDGGEMVGIIVDSARRLSSLIEDLLALSRIESRERRLETVSAERLLERTLADLQDVLEESGTVVTHSPLPEIKADPPLMIQLLQNLIGNAIKFRGMEAPRVHVAARRGPREWIFSVRDNGRGIDPGEVESVFTIFKRLHPEVPGSGIGLAICRKIVERHGGRVWVESEPGRGSNFLFTLPAPGEGSLL